MTMPYSHMAYHRCNGSIWRSIRRCYNRGIYQENGKDYCGVHAPSRIAARASKREAKRQGVKP